jgi:hypothetical protein
VPRVTVACAPYPSAAVSRPDTSLMDGSTAAWVDTVSTNVLGTALVTREAVASMEARGRWGHVVSVCCAEEGSGMHAATKQAVCAMAQELRCGRGRSWPAGWAEVGSRRRACLPEAELRSAGAAPDGNAPCLVCAGWRPKRGACRCGSAP